MRIIYSKSNDFGRNEEKNREKQTKEPFFNWQMKQKMWKREEKSDGCQVYPMSFEFI